MRKSVTVKGLIQSYSQSQRVEDPIPGLLVSELRLLTEFGEVVIRKPTHFQDLCLDGDASIAITIDYPAVDPKEEIGKLVDHILAKPVPGTADDVAARVKEALYLANLIRFGEKK
jgi:hypothetical protein